MNNEMFKAVVHVEDFPSRSEIMELLNDYFSENNILPQYTCDNKAHSLFITFDDSVIYIYIIIVNYYHSLYI